MVCDKDRLLVGEVFREFVFDGKLTPKAGSEALDRLMEQFAARSQESLNLPLGRLLGGDEA
jgi:hypothetical protein